MAIGAKASYAVAWVNVACPTQIWRPWHPQSTTNGLRVTPPLLLARVNSDQIWSGYFFRADRPSQDFFDASVIVLVGDGSRALFWMDRWLNGCSILQLAPDLWNAVPPRIRKSRTVWDALSGKRWIRDITFARTVSVVIQYLRLWYHQQNFHMSDRFIWKWSFTGEFSSSSTYRALF
jgi:hypothetical protein